MFSWKLSLGGIQLTFCVLKTPLMCAKAGFHKARRRLTRDNLILCRERKKLDKNVNGPCERSAVRSWSDLFEDGTSLALRGGVVLESNDCCVC